MASRLRVLLAAAVVSLVVAPDDLPANIGAFSSMGGWLALLAALAAAGWYAGRLRLVQAIPLLCGLGLALGLLAACTAAWWDIGNWPATRAARGPRPGRGRPAR